MARLIDADAFKQTFCAECCATQCEGCNIDYHFEHLAPTVDAVPVRHGKWLYGESESGHDGYYCSQCGKHIRWIYGEEDINFITSYNYCPKCGARMEVKE